MPQSLVSIIVLLSWLALPVGLVCIVDDWFLRPRRLIDAAAPPQDSPLMTFLYSALPVLIACAVLRLLVAERLDFSAVLLAITVLTGAVWAVDHWLLRPRRAAAARAAGKDPAHIPQPRTLDYAPSLFPVAPGGLLLAPFLF